MNKQLFMTFFKIGAFTIGGGLAMVPYMEREIVGKYKWLTKEGFVDIVAVTQSMPGVFAIDMASHIGYRVHGVRGSIMATLGALLPSLVIILLIAVFFQRFKEYPMVENVFKGIRPAVVALIAAPMFGMAKSAKITWYNIWIPVVGALLIWLYGVSPVYIIAAAGLGGYIYGKLKK